tara:strand:+ start:449 stop:1306 length:858 start_codon:yes stop_codon:yes gene_type:complete
MINNVLSIAGSDPSGGAGIQADLKSFSAQGVYGMAVITALTAQNTTGVSKIHKPPADFVAEQIRMVATDVRIDAIKIGMIADAAIAKVVAEEVGVLTNIPVILDPVMIAKGGAPLIAEDAMSCLSEELVPLADILTPNLPEAAALLKKKMALNKDDMVAQANQLLTLGPRAIYLKGGHFDGPDSPDLFVSRTEMRWFEAKRLQTKHTHGTGCSLSAAIAANCAKGLTPQKACATAKRFITAAISEADSLTVGTGHGPIHHFHHLWVENSLQEANQNSNKETEHNE